MSKTKQKQALNQIEDGVIGVGIQKENIKNPSIQNKAKSKKVAVFSLKNLYWDEVGRLLKGYNILNEEQAEKWLTIKHTRLATPEEIAGEFR